MYTSSKTVTLVNMSIQNLQGYKCRRMKVTWETCFLMLVAGRSLGRSLILWAREGESMMGWVEKSLDNKG